jgi:hypothetical protein
MSEAIAGNDARMRSQANDGAVPGEMDFLRRLPQRLRVMDISGERSGEDVIAKREPRLEQTRTGGEEIMLRPVDRHPAARRAHSARCLCNGAVENADSLQHRRHAARDELDAVRAHACGPSELTRHEMHPMAAGRGAEQAILTQHVHEQNARRTKRLHETFGDGVLGFVARTIDNQRRQIG